MQMRDVGAQSQTPPAPLVDRVEFPEGYRTSYTPLFTLDRPDARHVEVINEVFDLFAALDATDEQLLDAMAEHPILIERPFVVTDKGTRLARPIENVTEIL